LIEKPALTWDKDFFSQMLAAFPETEHYAQGAQTFLEEISQFDLCFDSSGNNQLDKICEDHTERTRVDNLQAIKLPNKKLPTWSCQLAW
jgi:hypothetical protein